MRKRKTDRGRKKRKSQKDRKKLAKRLSLSLHSVLVTGKYGWKRVVSTKEFHRQAGPEFQEEKSLLLHQCTQYYDLGRRGEAMQ